MKFVLRFLQWDPPLCMPLSATSHPCCSLLGVRIRSALGFSSLRHVVWNRLLVKMNKYKKAFLPKRRIRCDLKQAKSILVSQHDCQARAGEFPRNDRNFYFKQISRSHAVLSISWGALKCDKRASQASTNS